MYDYAINGMVYGVFLIYLSVGTRVRYFYQGGANALKYNTYQHVNYVDNTATVSWFPYTSIFVHEIPLYYLSGTYPGTAAPYHSVYDICTTEVRELRGLLYV